MWSITELLPEAHVTIIDVGASEGETPSYAGLVSADKATVIGFEPNPTECEKLNQRYGKAHRFFPYFVGDGTTRTFHETNWVATGSLFEPNTNLLETFQNVAEHTIPLKRYPVQTHRLDDISEIDDVDFIKIDVQGAELMVFQNAPRLLQRTVLIQCEVCFLELYHQQPFFSDVDQHLRTSGFQFHGFMGYGTRCFKPLIVDRNINKGIRQTLWADALYLRDWMKIGSLSTEKVMKLAVVSHDIIGSYDVAHFCLAELDRRNGNELAKNYLKLLSETRS